MVLYFTPRGGEESGHVIYMGRDKGACASGRRSPQARAPLPCPAAQPPPRACAVENEELIKYGFQEDTWFHVDRLSSAHVYLRLAKGKTIDDITKEARRACAVAHAQA